MRKVICPAAGRPEMDRPGTDVDTGAHKPAEREQLSVSALLDDPAVIHHQQPVRALHRAQPVRDDECRPPDQQPASASSISRSLSLSRLLVASSRMSTAGSLRMARAIATRCRCPPESLTPRSPTLVS